MAHLIVRFNTYVKGGGVITFVGSRAYQAVFWTIQRYNPVTEEYSAPLGSLKYARTKTDGSYCSVNVYLAPTVDPGDGTYDVCKVKWSD